MFLTVFLNCFQSSKLLEALYVLRSHLQLVSHQLLEWTMMLVIFEFFNQIESTELVWYDWHLLYTAWTRVKDNDNMIGCAAIVSVSTSYNRCYVLVSTSYIMTCLHYVLQTLFSWASNIYRVDTVLYLYTLPIVSTLIPFSSLCLSCNLSQT